IARAIEENTRHNAWTAPVIPDSRNRHLAESGRSRRIRLGPARAVWPIDRDQTRLAPSSTLDALNNAVASLPGARPSEATLDWVTIATMLSPPGISITISPFTAPGVTERTLPSRLLRADSRTS